MIFNPCNNYIEKQLICWEAEILAATKFSSISHIYTASKTSNRVINANLDSHTCKNDK